MKAAIQLTMSLITGCVLFFSSGKKDDTRVKPKHIGGSFFAFETEINGQTVTPSADEKIEIKITPLDNKHASVVLTYYNKDDKETRSAVNCTIGHDPDGHTILIEPHAVLYYDRNTISYFMPQGNHISASRDGKKPGWWI